MLLGQPLKPKRASVRGRTPAFNDADVWQPFGEGWRRLQGGFRPSGFSIDWHSFTPEVEVAWERAFNPDSIEICLNLSGHGVLESSGETKELSPSSAIFYGHNNRCLKATRRAGELHEFLTLKVSLGFLGKHLHSFESGLHPDVRKFLERKKPDSSFVSAPARLTNEMQQWVAALRRPPVLEAARRVWYQGKTLELISAFLYQSDESESLFCHRQQHLNQERVQKVLSILRENLSEPPTLEEMGRRVGCSHFYLSRLFTQEVGKTISVTLRDLRMERAAALLREGRLNVTQVALEVGYSSLSHFSSAFHEVIGCCPGLYPLALARK